MNPAVPDPRQAALALLQEQAADGAEFSVGTASAAVGVLVGSRRPADLQRLAALWRQATQLHPPAPEGTPLFLRCDFHLGRWTALTAYLDRAPALASRSPLTDQPLFCGSLRSRPNGGSEAAAYFDVRHRRPDRALALVDNHLQAAGWPSDVRLRLQETAGRILPFGWLQYVAVSGDDGKAKLDVATDRLSAALELAASVDRAAAQRLAGAMRRLGGALGYLGVVFGRGGSLDLRLYCRAFPCGDVAARTAGLGG